MVMVMVIFEFELCRTRTERQGDIFFPYERSWVQGVSRKGSVFFVDSVSLFICVKSIAK